ncbi:MAG TPA: condensation domain-containing protein, partial [Chitinophaga sp.]|uniref:condensation domain-containing protein n=1 Tax=Chitinophaga sp. TaxID=1869181 RepID=UPI002F922222
IVDGEPRQQVQDSATCEPDVQVTDLRSQPDNEMKAHDLMKQELALPFNLAAGSLLRIRLYQLQNEQHIFLLNMHHIIADGWSMEVLVKEVFERYTAGSAYINKPLPIQYKDYAGWINEQLSGAAIQQHEQYWLQQFNGEVPVLDLLTDHPRPAVKTSNGDTVPFVLDAALTTALSDLALQQEASLYMVLTAAVKAMLHRYTGQQDLVIGTPAAGRDHADLVNQIGLYVNTLALRTQFESDDSFSALLGKVKQTTLEAYDHQLYPFEQLVKATQLSYDRSRSPLTDVWIQYMDSTLQEKSNTTWNGLKITDLKLADKACKFDLAFEYIKAGEQVNVIIRYNTDLFKRATIHEMRNNLLFCLQQVTANEHIVLQEIQLLPSERETTTEDEFMAAIMK